MLTMIFFPAKKIMLTVTMKRMTQPRHTYHENTIHSAGKKRIVNCWQTQIIASKASHIAERERDINENNAP